jgi:hypothetical protein
MYQQRQRDGLDVDATAWDQIAALADELGIATPAPI